MITLLRSAAVTVATASLLPESSLSTYPDHHPRPVENSSVWCPVVASTALFNVLLVYEECTITQVRKKYEGGCTGVCARDPC